MQKVVFYGGSFDPPHFGHLWLINWIRLALEPKEILIAPTVNHPWKPLLRDFNQRARWIQAALGEQAGVSVVRAPELFTHHTIARLHRERPHDRFLVVLGSDFIPVLGDWEGWDTLTATADVLFVSRKGSAIPQNFRYPIVCPDLPQISSTQIRKWVATGDSDSLRHYVPNFIVEELLEERSNRTHKPIGTKA
jgi:nicotinate-nucleotide adenylyltransferase